MPIVSIEEVMRRAKGIAHEQTRRESEDYLELVMFQESLGEIHRIFTNYFGPPLKPFGEEVSTEVEKCAEAYGGIQTDQTLYYTEREYAPNLAMIWPWDDGKRVTVKIVQGCAR